MSGVLSDSGLSVQDAIAWRKELKGVKLTGLEGWDLRDAWLEHMRRAVDGLDLPADLAAELWTYLERAAYFMVNSLSE